MSAPRRPWVALSVAVAVLSLLAASAGARTRAYTAQYRGEYRLQMDTADAHGDSQHLLQTFSWTERVVTEVPDGGVPTSRVTLHAQGTLIQTGQGPSSPAVTFRCSATGINPPKDRMVIVITPDGGGRVGVRGDIPSHPGGTITVTSDPNCVSGSEWLLSYNGSELYSARYWNPNDLQSRMFLGALSAFDDDLPTTGGEKRYNADQTATIKPQNASDTTTGTISRSVHAVLSTGPGSPPLGGGPASGPPAPPTAAAQTAARMDLRSALDDAAGPCFEEGLPLGLLGAGVLVSGAGPIIGGGLVVAGGLTAPIAAPLCTAAIERVVADYRTFKDPPVAGIHEAARPAAVHAVSLPSCRRYHGRLRTFCSGLRGDDARFVVAVRHTTAVARALETTVGRATAARTAGDSAALALQEKTAQRLSVEFRSAVRAQRSAGAKVAERLRAAHLRYRLSAKQHAAAVRAVLARLAPSAITAAELRPVAGGAFSPGGVDLLALLAH
jgi:hypothetical protein